MENATVSKGQGGWPAKDLHHNRPCPAPTKSRQRAKGSRPQRKSTLGCHVVLVDSLSCIPFLRYEVQLILHAPRLTSKLDDGSTYAYLVIHAQVKEEKLSPQHVVQQYLQRLYCLIRDFAFPRLTSLDLPF